MVYQAKASHIGSCLSIADILAVLYDQVLKVNPADLNWPLRDRFILSKGHAAAVLYAVLAEKGFFPKEHLETYCQEGSPYIGHVSHHVPGVEISTGSLGHGLSIGCGMALAGQRAKQPYKTVVALSDGELQEGSVWEAALFAGHHRLNHLAAIVDYNKIQSFGRVKEVLDLEPLADKWKAFQWSVHEIDGHDHGQLLNCLCQVPSEQGKPTVIIAHTIKGKGISFMENNLEWHYKTPNSQELQEALKELERPS